jgi:hypothetical protein
MRERVLRRARGEASEGRGRFRLFALPWLRPALAALGVLIVLFAALSDSARLSRLAALENHNAPETRALVAARPVTMAQWRAELYRLTESPSDGTR